MGSEWSKTEDSENQNNETNAKEVEKAPSVSINEMKSNAATTELQLPHSYEEIVRDADSPLDKTSVKKLYEQLYDGVLLNRNKKKYWIDKKSNANCFMLYATDLLITWADDNRFWQWNPLKESNDLTTDVAELLRVCWLEVHGKLETRNLTPGIIYEVLFVIMLKDRAYGWEVAVNLRLLLPNGVKHQREESLQVKPKGKWIEILVGEFRASTNMNGEMEISLYEYEGGVWKKGLVVKGVIIRPKRE